MINPAAANIATPTNEKRFDGVSPVTGSESCVVLVVELVVLLVTLGDTEREVFGFAEEFDAVELVAVGAFDAVELDAVELDSVELEAVELVVPGFVPAPLT